MAAGNFDGNAYGQEQVVFTYVTKTKSKKDNRYLYSHSMAFVRNANPGTTSSDDGVAYKVGYEVKWNLTSSNLYEDDGHYSPEGLYLNLLPIDCDKDGQLSTFTGKDVSYSEPEVLAVLQSSPYFDEVSQFVDDNYPNNGETGFGKSTGSSVGGSVSASVSAGLSFGFKQDVSVFGLKLASVEFETSMTTSFGYEYAHEKEVTTSVDYAQGVGMGNSVVVYTIPYVNYHYNVYIPDQTVPTDADEFEAWLKAAYPGGNGETGYADMSNREKTAFKDELKTQGIAPGEFIKGHYDVMTVSIPKQAVNTMLATEVYDEIAAKTKQLEQIDGNVLTNTVGDPVTYNKTIGDFTQIGEKKNAGHSGGTISVSQEIQTSNSNTFETSIEYNYSAKHGLAGGDLGISAGWGMGASVSVSNFNGVTYSGTVDCLPPSAKNYDFSWTFGQGVAKINGNKTPVLQYKVSDVIQPVRTPENFQVEEAGIEEMSVSWEKTRDAQEYALYVYDKNEKDYVLVDTVDSQTNNYTFQNLLTGCKYSFGLCAVNGDEYSAMNVIEDSTMPANALYVTLTQDMKDMSVHPGDSAVLTCDGYYKWNNATGANASRKYIWQKWDEESGTWKNMATTDTNSYTIKNVDYTMEGAKIRCKLSFSYGTIYIYSSTITMHLLPFDTATNVTVEGGHNGVVVPDYEVNEKVLDVAYTYDNEIFKTTEDGTSYQYNTYEVPDDYTAIAGNEVYERDGKYYALTAKGESTGEYTSSEYTSTVGRGYYLGGTVGIANDGFEDIPEAEQLTLTSGEYTKATGADVSGDLTLHEKQTVGEDKVYIASYLTSITKYGDKEDSTETEEVVNDVTASCYVVKSGSTYTAYNDLSYEEDYITVGETEVSIGDLVPVTVQNEKRVYNTKTYTKAGENLKITAAVTSKSLPDTPFGDVIVTISKDGEEVSHLAGLLDKNGKISLDWVAPEEGEYTFAAEYYGVMAAYSGYGVPISGSMTESSVKARGIAVSFYDEEGNEITVQHTCYDGTVDFLTQSDEQDWSYAYYIGSGADKKRISTDYKFTEDTKVTAQKYEFSANAEGIYEINSAKELVKFAKLVNDGQNKLNAKLMSNIDMTGVEYTPIGYSTNHKNTTGNWFEGTFDGNGFRISGLDVTNYGIDAGLIGVNRGTVKNVTIASGTIGNTNVSADNRNGSIVGANFGTIEHCINYASVNGYFSVGGIAGTAEQGSVIRNCINAGMISAKAGGVGGITYYIGGTVENCINVGTVKSNKKDSVGPIVANLNTEKGSYKNCYYVKGSEDTAYTGSVIGTNITSADMASGKYAYELNEAAGQTLFGQTLSGNSTDAYPVNYNGSNAVYQVQVQEEDGTVAQTFYANKGMKLSSLDFELYTAADGEIPGNYRYYLDGDLVSESDEVAADTVLVRKVDEITQNASDNYYEIGTVEEFNAFARAQRVSNKGTRMDVRLTADLDFTGLNVTRIAGDVANQSCTGYFGTFDGQEHTMTGLSGDSPLIWKAYVGSQLLNMNFEKVSLTEDKSSISAVCNTVAVEDSAVPAVSDTNRTIVKNCHVKSGQIYGSIASGLFSEVKSDYTTIENCSNAANITGRMGAYGILYSLNSYMVSSRDHCILKECKNSGAIRINENKSTTRYCCNAAGIAAYANFIQEISGCENTGSISGTAHRMCGLIIWAGAEKVHDCINRGNVSEYSEGVQMEYVEPTLVSGVLGQMDPKTEVYNLSNYGKILSTGTSVYETTQGSIFDFPDCVSGIICKIESKLLSVNVTDKSINLKNLNNYGDIYSAQLHVTSGVLGCLAYNVQMGTTHDYKYAAEETMINCNNYGNITVGLTNSNKTTKCFAAGILGTQKILAPFTAYIEPGTLEMTLKSCMNAGTITGQLNETGPLVADSAVNYELLANKNFFSKVTMEDCLYPDSDIDDKLDGSEMFTETQAVDGSLLELMNDNARKHDTSLGENDDMYGQLFADAGKYAADQYPVAYRDMSEEKKALSAPAIVTYKVGSTVKGTEYSNVGASLALPSSEKFNFSTEGRCPVWESADNDNLYLADGKDYATIESANPTFKLFGLRLADRTALNKTVNAAEVLMTSPDYEQVYTTDSRKALKTAYDAAVILSTDEFVVADDQTKVDNANTALKKAYDTMARICDIAVQNAGENVEVKVSASQDAYATDGDDTKYLSGTTLTVTAICKNNVPFTGWYDGGELVSENNTYEFVVRGDTNLVAFAGQNSVVHPSYAGGTLYTSSELPQLSTASGDTVGTITLDSDQKLAEGTNSYKWTFTPEDTDNFAVEKGTIDLTVQSVYTIQLNALCEKDETVDYMKDDLEGLKKHLKVTASSNDGTKKVLDKSDYTVKRTLQKTGNTTIAIFEISYSNTQTSLFITQKNTYTIDGFSLKKNMQEDIATRITVANGTSLDDVIAKLPKNVYVVLADEAGKKEYIGVEVQWKIADYDAEAAGTYTVQGSIAESDVNVVNDSYEVILNAAFQSAVEVEEPVVIPSVNPEATPSSSPVVKKGATYTVNSMKYKVTSVDSQGNGTVTLTATKASKKITSLTINSTVKINKKTFKITAIEDKVFKSFKKIKKVTIGTNVTSIGKETFSGCKALMTITIKSKNVEKIGDNAIKNINKKAKIKVPKSKLKDYKKLFKSSTGFKKSMKITK